MSTRIVRDPAIHDGQPIIEGTRWETSIVRGYDYNLMELRYAYPHLTDGQIWAAIKYERTWHRRLYHGWWTLRQRVGAWITGVDGE